MWKLERLSVLGLLRVDTHGAGHEELLESINSTLHVCVVILQSRVTFFEVVDVLRGFIKDLATLLASLNMPLLATKWDEEIGECVVWLQAYN